MAAAETVEDVEKRKRRRAYMRGMMKLYRDEFRIEMTYLRNREERLKRQISQLVRAKCPGGTAENVLGPLSWNEVSLALKEDHQDASTTQKSLQKQVDEWRRVVETMQEWVQAHTTIPESPNAAISTWRNTTLLADPIPRQLGKQWITKQMLHNADRVFQLYEFQAMDKPYDLYDLEAIPTLLGGFEYIHRRQFDINHSVADLLALYRDTLGTLISPDAAWHTKVADEKCHGTKLHTLYNSNDEVMHLLSGAFPHGDRTIFVVQEILHDELLPKIKPKQRHRMLWYDILALSPSKTRLQCLYIYSQCVDVDGHPIPFEDEARSWGFDPSSYPPEIQEEKFREHVRAMARQRLFISQARVQEYSLSR
ncbi:hypothetical protein LEN26_001151 [Aphanomyces euteiches]|nr:hypothetical protein AeMF1_003094 [Aphanomyces euteiches]KAH9162000.1 hypothetical protein LEN26_001151 [Aphanomyces euteiches]